jgi:hypothetical protein
MTSSALNPSQFSLTKCCNAPMVMLSHDNDDLPRCAGCGHRKPDPETGTRPTQTRERGPSAWLTEMPNRLRAQRAGRSS